MRRYNLVVVDRTKDKPALSKAIKALGGDPLPPNKALEHRMEQLGNFRARPLYIRLAERFAKQQGELYRLQAKPR